VKSVKLDTVLQRFVIKVHDGQGKELQAIFPAVTDSVTSPSWVATELIRGHWCEVGSPMDRDLMTVISMALEADRASSFEELNLKVLLNARRTKILESDGKERQ
jgi:hypothetical protein